MQRKISMKACGVYSLLGLASGVATKKFGKQVLYVVGIGFISVSVSA